MYDRFRGQIDFIFNMEFDQIKDVTLVIVTSFGRFGAEHIDEPRLCLNFLEVVLPTYTYFKNKTASVKVVSIPTEKLEQLNGLDLRIYEDLTWQAELTAEVYELVFLPLSRSTLYR